MTDAWAAAMAALGIDADDITLGMMVPLAPTLPQALIVTADALNIRRGSGVAHERIGAVAKGTLLDGWHEQGAWVLVTGDGVAGWVSKQWMEVR